MKVLLKNATILDRASDFFNQKKDILIADSKIIKIEDSINDENAQIITSDSLHVSQSWVDLKADFRDPGHEEDEDIQSGTKVAKFGGFGHVFLVPTTNPIIDSKGQVNYVRAENKDPVCQIYPMGAITKNATGKSLAELFDLYQNGVRLFTDNTHFISSGILMRALLYVENFGGKIVSFPQDYSIHHEGQVNEGIASLKTGLKAIPAIGEVIRVERDLRLVEYTDGSIHFTGISTAQALSLIRKAKQKGLKVTCDVHIHQLLFNEEAVLGFDTNHKVLPPYRPESDRIALWEGVKDGTIDCIVSNHQPFIKEKKDIEFDHAEFGCLTLQTFYSALIEEHLHEQEYFIDKISTQPRIVLDFKENTSINIGSNVDLTIFDHTITWIYDENTNLSKSNNSPFLGKEMKGKVIGIIKGDSIYMNH